jgi:hypothetical protein
MFLKPWGCHLKFPSTSVTRRVAATVAISLTIASLVGMVQPADAQSYERISCVVPDELKTPEARIEVKLLVVPPTKPGANRAEIYNLGSDMKWMVYAPDGQHPEGWVHDHPDNYKGVNPMSIEQLKALEKFAMQAAVSNSCPLGVDDGSLRKP